MDGKTIEPASIDDVADALRQASVNRHRVLIRGAGTKLSWGAPPDAAPPDLALSTTKLNAIIAHRHGDLTATVQAGATLADVNRALAQHRQWLPLDPPWADRATIGGVVATNDSGPRRHRYGAPRDLVIGMEFVRADGVAAKAGGIVVKNVAGYDVSRLLTGSFGSLAVVVSATFKLFPHAESSRTVVIDLGAPSVEPLGGLLGSLLASQLTPTAIELQSPPARLLVRFETIATAAQQQAEAVAGLAAAKPGVSASIVSDDEEQRVWSEHDCRPWNGDGAVIKVTLLPTAVAPTLAWIAEAFGGADNEVIGRAGVGVLLVRIGGDEERQANAIAALRTRVVTGSGSAVLVRGSDQLKARVDVWGPMGDAFSVMRAIKQRFDPLEILNPGRGPGGL
jgi:glycolate oxidase FAD binding subunit